MADLRPATDSERRVVAKKGSFEAHRIASADVGDIDISGPSLSWQTVGTRHIGAALGDNAASRIRSRKTGASEIEKIDPTVTEMYLAHSEKGMKRNYAERDWAALRLVPNPTRQRFMGRFRFGSSLERCRHRH